MMVGFQGSVIKMLIVGFEFVCASNSFVSLGIGDYAFICQVKDSSSSTVFNFHCSWFSKIKVRRCYSLKIFYYLRSACFLSLYLCST